MKNKKVKEGEVERKPGKGTRVRVKAEERVASTGAGQRNLT